MDYNLLLDLATDLGHRLAMAGAETFRVEESINRVLATYGIASEVFAIPNCLTVSIQTPDGVPMTRMRRVGYHGNDLDAVERYSNLSRRICAEHPEPEAVAAWLLETDSSCIHYGLPGVYLGSFLGAFGFSALFGGGWGDALCGGLCGLLVGFVNHFMDKLHANLFFRTILAAFALALPAYAAGALGLIRNVDAAVIGPLMLLVPGLLFTNAMRDIIFGDTNSGINRIVQVFLIAAAIALGTAAAWNCAAVLWGAPAAGIDVARSLPVQLFACLLGCIGFSILFNIHGPGGVLCTLGGVLVWAIYVLVQRLGASDIAAYFWATAFAAAYAESMARIRKFPAISYLVVSIFPLIPGAGVYFTMNCAVQGNMSAFAERGMHTVAIAGVMAVAILLVSTIVRMLVTWRRSR